MARLIRDPLLTFAKILIIALMSMAAVSALGMLVGIPIAIINRQEVFGEVLSQSGVGSTMAMAIIISGFVLMFVLLALLFSFMENLRRIVGSVSNGDPFSPINATRLGNMGWIMVGVHLVAIPISMIAGWVTSYTGDSELSLGGPGGGILLIVVLFILARVFKMGAEMREDIEGTV